MTVQAAVPLHAPLQPVKIEFAPGAAVRVTLSSSLKFALQVVPQLIPLGLLVTVPVPLPAKVTVNDDVPTLKLAVTEVAAEMVTVQDPVPLHAPPQPANTESELGVAVSVTLVLSEKDAVQLLPQLMPEGELVTVPAPLPELLTVNWNVLVGLGDPEVRPLQPARAANMPTRHRIPATDLADDMNTIPPHLQGPELPLGWQKGSCCCPE